MGLRSQLGWMRNGAERTNATMAAYATELRALQEKVEALTQVVARLDATIGRSDAEHSAEIEAMKDQLRTVTSDLGDRVGSLSMRLESQLGV
jgi:division protein CdvB (Snf7/Vps24/ESCRT-III family)